MLEFIEWAIRGLLWIAAGPLDRRRIRRFFECRGESVESIRWAPLTTGWMSHWYDRLYCVRYDNARGSVEMANCRTSWWTGVIITSADEGGEEGIECV